jgi:hypothetical protein
MNIPQPFAVSDYCIVISNDLLQVGKVLVAEDNTGNLLITIPDNCTGIGYWTGHIHKSKVRALESAHTCVAELRGKARDSAAINYPEKN